MKIFITKLFSPAWDVPKYKKNLKGYSDDFCHNLARLIMRPNSRSRQHWITELLSWYDKALSKNIVIKKKPVHYIFSDLLSDNNNPNSWDENQVDNLCFRVGLENMYGNIVNDDPNYVLEKVKELYQSINPMKTYSSIEVTINFYSWYNSIDGVNVKYKL
jgi:hypothetical protein